MDTLAERMRLHANNRRSAQKIKLDAAFMDRLLLAQKGRCFYCEEVLTNKAYTPTKKNGYTITEKPKDERQLYIKGCSCGWCYECRNKNANQWRVRLKEEVKSNEFKNMIFATFTFSEEEYSKLAKEVRGDIIKNHC